MPRSTPIHWIGCGQKPARTCSASAREAKRRIARWSVPRRMRDVHLDHARSAGENQSLRELLLADRSEHRLDGVATVRVECAPEVRDVHACKAAEHPVDHARRQGTADRVLARAAAAACDVVAGLDRLDEPRDVFGLVLQIAVHRHHHIAASARQARVHCRVLAEVALEPHRTHARIAAVQALHRSKRAVRRAVVHEDQLERPRAGVESRDRPPIKLLHRRGLVEEGHDDRDVGRREVGLGDPPCLHRFDPGHEQRIVRAAITPSRDARSATPGRRLTLPCLRHRSIGACSP